MSKPTRWQIGDVSVEAREMARDAAVARNISVGDWLDEIIRQRTGLAPDNPALATATPFEELPVDILQTLQDLEDRVATKAEEVEKLVAPLESSVDRLGERLHSLHLDSDSAETSPFFAEGAVTSEADQQTADVTTAANMRSLYDDGAHRAAGRADDAMHIPVDGLAPRPVRDTGQRRMMVAAAFVVVIAAIVATIYQWASVSVRPQDGPGISTQTLQTPAALPQPPAPSANTTATGADGSDATSKTAALSGVTSPPADTGRTEPTESPSPVSPAVAADSAVAVLYRKAKAGEPRSQYDLAVHYIQGRDIPQDYAAATYWLKRAAASGLATAQYNLGVMYNLGLGGAKDPVQALMWFHAAAELDHARSKYALGLAYAEGKGIPRDDASARRWFTAAAEAGVAESQLALGIMHDEGIGGPADPQRAYYWFRQAQINGSDRAGGRIAVAASRLSTEQRSHINDRVSRDVTRGLARYDSPSPAASAASASVPAAPENRDTVRAVQQLLAGLGFDPGPADGSSGPRTRAAIEEYQRALDLPVDGRASDRLLVHLRDVSGLPAEN